MHQEILTSQKGLCMRISDSQSTMRLLVKQNLLNHCHLINDDYLDML